jgi:hypothetical protein
MNRQVVSHNSREVVENVPQESPFFDQPNAVSCSQGQ